jgi:hypothetical protein
MDAELHRVSDAVGDVQEALLPVHTAGVDVPRRSVRGLSDPQQLHLQLCPTYEHNEYKKQMQSFKSK